MSGERLAESRDPVSDLNQKEPLVPLSHNKTTSGSDKRSFAAVVQAWVPKPPAPLACIVAPERATASAGGSVGEAPAHLFKRNEKKVLIIKEKEVNEKQGEKTGEELRAVVSRIPGIQALLTQINRLVAIHQGVVLELRDDDSRQKIKSLTDLADAGLVATCPSLKRPEIKIYDVSKDMTDSKVERDVIENLKNWEKRGDEVKLVHRFEQKERGLMTVIMMVSPEARVEILSDGRSLGLHPDVQIVTALVGLWRLIGQTLGYVLRAPEQWLIRFRGRVIWWFDHWV
mgnify:CR=1 FL=1